MSAEWARQLAWAEGVVPLAEHEWSKAVADAASLDYRSTLKPTPSSVNLAVDNSTQITVSWSAGFTAVDHDVLRAPDELNNTGVLETIASGLGDVESYVDTNAPMNRKSWYVVRGYDGDGNSEDSPPVAAWTPALISDEITDKADNPLGDAKLIVFPYPAVRDWTNGDGGITPLAEGMSASDGSVSFELQLQGQKVSVRRVDTLTPPRVSGAVTDFLNIHFEDSFEDGIANWSDFGSGTVIQDNAQAFDGSYSLLKQNNNDPNGGIRRLHLAESPGVLFWGYVFRPSNYAGDGDDALALVDVNGDGYGFRVDHDANEIAIHRRDGGTPTTLGTVVSFDPPEDQWYQFALAIYQDSTFKLQLFNTSDSLLKTVEVGTADTTYTTFNRILVAGGHKYWTDLLRVA